MTTSTTTKHRPAKIATKRYATHKEQYAAKIETLRRKEVRKMKTSWA